MTRVPALWRPGDREQAAPIAAAIARRLDYVGVLAVEMFLCDGRVRASVVNEIAPRVHNSGHWTIEGAAYVASSSSTSAPSAGWPLGSVARLGRVEMRNLIGDDVDAWASLLGEPGAHLHLYGKPEARPGRKMGHVTRVFSNDA